MYKPKLYSSELRAEKLRLVKVPGCDLDSHLGYFVLLQIDDFPNGTYSKAPKCIWEQLSAGYKSQLRAGFEFT